MIVTAAPVHGFGRRQTAFELAQQSATVMSLTKMLSSNRLFVARARKQLPALCQQRPRRRRRTIMVRRKGIKGRIKAAPQLLLRRKVKALLTLSLLLLRSPKVQARETLPLLISRRGRRLCPRQQRCQPLKRQKFRVCRAKSCAFLHSPTEKYTGPPPRALSKAKSPALLPPQQSQVSPPGTIASARAAGRQLIGKQALNSTMMHCVRKTNTPVGFATGGGAQQRDKSLAFEDSRVIPPDEQVYVWQHRHRERSLS